MTATYIYAAIGTYEMRRHFKAAMEKGKAKTKIAKVF